MKKTYLALLALPLLFGACKKEETPGGINSVSTVYKPFLLEFSASWCHVCGHYAFPAWEGVFAAHQGDITGISVHPDDNIVLTAYAPQADMETFYQVGGGYPSSGINTTGNFQSMSTNSWESRVNTARTANPKAKAGIGLKYSVDGSTVTVNTTTVLFEDLSGTYNLAVYLTEDDIIEDQRTDAEPPASGQTWITNAEHDRVFRGAAGDKAWGTTIIASSGSKDQKIDGSYTITIPSDVRNKEKLHVTVVLYKMNGTNPEAVINSNAL